MSVVGSVCVCVCGDFDEVFIYIFADVEVYYKVVKTLYKYFILVYDTYKYTMLVYLIIGLNFA